MRSSHRAAIPVLPDEQPGALALQFARHAPTPQPPASADAEASARSGGHAIETELLRGDSTQRTRTAETPALTFDSSDPFNTPVQPNIGT